MIIVQILDVFMTVVKIGGSLIRYKNKIVNDLINFSKKNSKPIIIVPGGGPFVDFIRKFKLNDDHAHWMAVLGMNQYGYLLAESTLLPVVESFNELKPIVLDKKDANNENKIVIFLPYNELRRYDDLPHSWNVTSDAIAAWVASKINQPELVIATDVEGIYKNGELVNCINAKELSSMGETCVDRFLPIFLKKKKMSCRVVYGKDSANIIKVLEGGDIGTKIIP